MPIRFQVDPDFYDHPKAIGMSDAATALWVRAGSYSAAKLSDGFVAEAALSLLSRCPEEAAGELVMRGLWRRVKGGYRFHQWSPRNLTRARVEADKTADRLRKQSERKAAGQNPKPQVNDQIVQPDSAPDSRGSPNGVHPLSVSESVSESVSGSGHGSAPPPTSLSVVGQEPPRQCPKHLDDPDPPNCHNCGEARKAHEAWEADEQQRQLRRDQERRHREALERAEVVRLAIANCRDCDDGGYLPTGAVCPHDPSVSDRARRGAAAIRALLADPKGAA